MPRFSCLVLILPVALASACSPAPSAASGAKGEPIACALAGAQAFANDCVVEWVRGGGKSAVIVRHPDGAFRRFLVLDGGRGLAAADGAFEAGVAANGALLDVRVGDDRYRFPQPLRDPANVP